MGTPRRKIATPTVVATPSEDGNLTSVPLLKEIVVERSVLRRALTSMTRVADKKSHLPVLSHVFMRTDGSRVRMVATDLTTWLTLHVASGKPSDSCALTAPAHVLSALVRTMPDGDVALRPDGSSASIECGPVRSRMDVGSHFDYPKIPTAGDATFTAIDGASLREALDMVKGCMSLDDTRRQLNGVLLESDGVTLTAVATDGHRLSVARRGWTGPEIKGVLIPRSGVEAITRFPACDMAITESMMFLRHGDDEMAVKLLDEQFPPYRQVIPMHHTALVTLSRDSLVSSLERAKLCCVFKRGCTTRGATLAVADGALTVSAGSADGNTMSERIEADFVRSARVGINPIYLIEALAPISEGLVTLSLGDSELDPIIVRSLNNAAMYPLLEASLLTVIMPMRL